MARKRETNPGVRVIGRRIYDSKNGKSCHQCRQKTLDFAAPCKVMKKNKLCPIKFCYKCLSNRYGENAEEVAKLDDWMCPLCRGICICSVCRTSRGQQPTGILAPQAKARGLSVYELLEVEGHDKFAYQKKPKLVNASNEGSSNSESVPGTKVRIIDVAKEKKKKVKSSDKLKEDIQFETQLPQGISLTCVSSIDIPTEEAGNVCQLFEFCSAFRKALALKEEHAETIVRELFVCGRDTRRQQYSSIIQMMIQLLDLISKDREMSLSLSATDNSWFTAIGEIILQSKVLSDEFPLETFVAGVAAYEKMNASRKLKLLNFLCDESLSTWAMRNYIKSQTRECGEQKKEAKQKAAAAKEKEKELKQMLQGEVAKAIMEKNGAPLSIEEHNSVVSQIKDEAKEAHEEMIEAKGMKCGMTVICDVRRTEPIMLDDNGFVIWKLKCFEEEQIFLLQDLGTFDDLCPHERWLAFKPEHKPEIEKYISSKRRKLRQTQKNTNPKKECK
ncbi:WHIM1 domain [Arabidopsis suecica]|uniref:WHIM1 domain n=1 Tax=Arabidopsis suecica TaxID=45249 RepID=A0A8T2BNW6_ARASU|nr:WHIM1 domain [Arabidopsis suecica]